LRAAGFFTGAVVRAVLVVAGADASRTVSLLGAGLATGGAKLTEQTETELRSRVSSSAHLQHKQSNALQ
jgi:hypothetical protein